MSKVRIKISTKPGKRGTKIAEGKIRVAPAKDPGGDKPIFRTSAQVGIRINTDSNGQPRKGSRF